MRVKIRILLTLRSSSNYIFTTSFALFTSFSSYSLDIRIIGFITKKEMNLETIKPFRELLRV